MLDNIARQWHLEQLEKFIDILGYLVEQTSHADATQYRDGGDGWTVLEVMGHLYDFEPVFMERVRLTVEQDTPALPVPGADELVSAGNYNSRHLAEVYNQWVIHRKNHLAYLRGLDEAAFDRAGQHPKRGRLTVDQQLMLACWHDLNHLRQMTQTLRLKQ